MTTPTTDLPRACILTIGDELLEGRVDTNSAWISLALDRIGWRVLETRHCRDNIDAITRNLEELSALAPLVITTGGLGPTTDDLTTDAVLRWAGAEADVHQPTLDRMLARFKERGLTMPEGNQKQAMYPRGATPVPNGKGTAMGYIAERGQCLVASFPGVPREMKPMVENALLPFLTERFPPRAHRAVRKLKIFGHPESAVNALMAGITQNRPGIEVAYLVSYPDVSLFFKVTRTTEAEAAALANELAVEARQRLGDKCYGENEDTLESVVGALLKAKGLALATAESCTGGLLSQRITDIAGSSAYFIESDVTYHDGAKQRLLGVKSETLREFGAVSAETCEEMLNGLLTRSGASVGISVTGIAGPGGGTAEKPVGLVYIGWGDADGQEIREFHFAGERSEIRQVAASTALDRLRRFLLQK